MSDRASIGFYDTVVDRTLGKLRNVWREIATSTRGVLSGAPRPDLADDDPQHLRQQMQSCLDGSGGEVSARARAAELGRTYLALNRAGRESFLHVMAEEFDIDRAAVDRCCTRLAAAKNPAERAPAERALRAALTAPRVKLLRQFNALPEGVKFLVDRRDELIALADGDPAMRFAEWRAQRRCFAGAPAHSREHYADARVDSEDAEANPAFTQRGGWRRLRHASE